MVVYEEVNETTVRAYSDAGKMIRGGFPEGVYAEAYDPKDAHRTYVETDEYVPTSTQPPVRTYDKYLLVDALMEAGVWPAVKDWLHTVPNAYDRAVMAPDISEDEPLLADGIAAVKQLLGWTDAQVEAVLARSVKNY